MAKNINDKSIAEWLIPNFTIITPTDRVCASVSVMSAMQNFFNYMLGGGCGLPQVTLLGEIFDWEILRAKIDRLLEFKIEGKSNMQKWHSLLAPIFEKLVESASGRPDLHFWETFIRHSPMLVHQYILLDGCQHLIYSLEGERGREIVTLYMRITYQNGDDQLSCSRP